MGLPEEPLTGVDLIKQKIEVGGRGKALLYLRDLPKEESHP